MLKPNFLIIGAAKAGTTSLYAYLKQHPQIYMSPLKETNFFALEGAQLLFQGPGDQEYINKFSITKLEDYSALFQEVNDELAIGEASPLYLYSPRAPERIQHYIPEVKVIAILRHPVERAYSAFLHMVRDRREPLRDFPQTLKEEEARIDNNWEHIWHYQQAGFYYVQLQRYFAQFNSEQIRVYLFDDFALNPLGVLQDIFQFLNVNETFIPDISMRQNASEIPTNLAKLELTAQVYHQLMEVYREDICRLQELIQRDLSNWLEPEISNLKVAGTELNVTKNEDK